ncbi:MAG: helix-turn-helix domain-containing protein [Blastocatellia bacterium]
MEVAQRLNESRRTVLNWVMAGIFPGATREETRVGSYWLIPESALKGFEKPKRGRPPKKLAGKTLKT